MISDCLPLVCTGLADSAGNVSISVSAPVTSVNGMTGAVTISSVSTATTASATPNVHIAMRTSSTGNVYVTGGTLTMVEGTGCKYTFPAGGTWRYLFFNASNATGGKGTASGGGNINTKLAEVVLIAVRIS